MKYIFTFFAICFFSILSFTQNDSCKYTLVLTTTIDNGWSGAAVNIISKSYSNSYTISTASTKTEIYDFYLKSNDTLSIRYTRGTNDVGNSYVLLNSKGLLVFKDGLYPDTGLVYKKRLRCSDCPIVQSVFPTNIKAVTAKWNWTPTAGVAGYVLKYSFPGFFSEAPGTKLFTTDTFATIKNLEEKTKYHLYVATVCSNGDTSYWNGPFEFTTLWRNDVGMFGAAKPLNSCDMGIETVTALIKNFGGDPQAPIKFGYRVNGVQPGIPDIVDGLYTNVVGKDSIAKIDFETMFDFTKVGEYQITTWTELPTDSDKRNDTALIVITHIPTFNTLPIKTNFESWASGWTVDHSSVNPSWKYGSPSGQYATNAASLNKGWFADLNSSNNELSYLLSPCLDFTNITKDPILEMSLLYKLQSPALWVEVSKDDIVWTKLGAPNEGKNWYNNSDSTWSNGNTGWQFSSHVLTGLAGSSNARIRFVLKGNQAMGGIGIDNINISAAPKRDIVAASIKNLSQNECGLPKDSIKLLLTNNGNQIETGFNVSYKVNGLATVTENVGTFILLAGESKVYTFKTTANTAIPGNLTIRSWSNLTADENKFNDTTDLKYFNGGLPLPLIETFESGYPANWTTTPNVFTVGSGHGTSSNVLYAALTPLNRSGEFSIPLYGLVKSGQNLKFDYRIVENGAIFGTLSSKDSIILYASRNCDNQFTKVLRIDSLSHTPSIQMKRMTISLNNYVGSYIKLKCVVYRNGGNPIFVDFDNINISDCGNVEYSATVDNTYPDINNGKITIDPTGGNLPYTYKWSNGGNDFKIFGLGLGDYQVTITDAIGCQTIASFTIGKYVKNIDQEWLNSVSIQPNPNQGSFVLNASFTKNIENLDIQIYSLTGHKLKQTKLKQVSTIALPMDLIEFGSGLYFVRFVADNNQWVQKIIITK